MIMCLSGRKESTSVHCLLEHGLRHILYLSAHGEGEEDEEDLDEEADPELRRKIEEALAVNGIRAADSEDESDEELMDDDQMMAIDEQLVAVFKARADEKKLGKGPSTSIRVHSD